IILTTCPRDCYDACGIAVIKQSGVIKRVRGDPNNPINRGGLCGKCAIAYNGVIRDPNQRLKTPFKRVGPKGLGQFQTASWDEAIETTAGRLQEIVAHSGPEAVLNAHYTGTMSRIAYAFPLRFFNRLGATEVEPDTICNMAGQVALQYTIGNALAGFDPRTARDAHCIVVWGANPWHSAPHAHSHWLPEAPGKKIVIDPVRHRTAQRADLHLQLFPGSDAALAFSILHVLCREGMIDKEFIERHVLGWEEVEPLIDNCPPSWGEAVTGVPARKIEEAARTYGSGPSLLWLGQGMQRQPHGGNAIRACAMLPAATGNFGKPGSGLYYLNMDGGIRGIDDDYVTAPHLRSGKRTSFSHMELAQRLEPPSNIRALFCWNINPAASNPEQKRLRQALCREDLFSVVIDLFQTDTADFADIVLPAASFLEFDDLVTSYFNLTIAPQVKAQEPVGESLPNQEIFRRLARAMGYREPELYESDESIIEHLLRGTSYQGGFEGLKQTGTVFISPEPMMQFADLQFPTPSGKIEIASSQAECDGHPRVPQPIADPRPSPRYLRLLSPASLWLMNDSFGNDAGITRQLGAASITLNPQDAVALGLNEGDKADVSNEIGRLVLQVRVSDEIPQGVALSPKGRWPKSEQDQANVNALNPGKKTDMGESTSVHGVEVFIRPASPGRRVT
ncbi:MAG TPA: molybdopterin-dependent oxidoreductase, partial [Dehalococcoidia bacterium]|nr:molybdopterin-dependent oxidoreductase [Dehalococcoidia bacterium]